MKLKDYKLILHSQSLHQHFLDFTCFDLATFAVFPCSFKNTSLQRAQVCIHVMHIVKKFAIDLLFLIDHYDRAHFALGCSLSYCFRAYLLRQHILSPIWLFRIFFCCLGGFTSHAIGGSSKVGFILNESSVQRSDELRPGFPLLYNSPLPPPKTKQNI